MNAEKTKNCICGLPAGIHMCHFCGEPICESCLITYVIDSKTHSGRVYLHPECNERSSMKNFKIQD